MILKDNKFEDILLHIRLGAVKLEECDLVETNSEFTKAFNICRDLIVDDLNVSNAHINAVMKKEKIESEEEAKKYVLKQLQDTFKRIIGAFLVLDTFAYLETLQE